MSSANPTTNTFDASKSGFAVDKNGGKTGRKINENRANVWKEKEITLREQLKNAKTSVEKKEIQRQIKHAQQKQKTSEPHGRQGQGF